MKNILNIFLENKNDSINKKYNIIIYLLHNNDFNNLNVNNFDDNNIIKLNTNKKNKILTIIENNKDNISFLEYKEIQNVNNFSTIRLGLFNIIDGKIKPCCSEIINDDQLNNFINMNFKKKIYF